MLDYIKTESGMIIITGEGNSEKSLYWDLIKLLDL